MTTCPTCPDLSERLRLQAATNRALIKECDRLREQVLMCGLRELRDAKAIDFKLKDALIADDALLIAIREGERMSDDFMRRTKGMEVTRG